MSLFKCKMCGGDLEVAEGLTIAECEYCGTKQTVPKAMDENLQNLFNRANTLRMLIAPTATAGGGCGRPATFSLKPPMSTVTAASTRPAAVSMTMISLLSAPLCGSI